MQNKPLSQDIALQMAGSVTLGPIAANITPPPPPPDPDPPIGSTPAEQVAWVMDKHTNRAWYDISDRTSLYSNLDATGVSPAGGTPVGFILDKAQMGGKTAAEYLSDNGITDPLTVPGFHMVAFSSTVRPIFRADGIYNALNPGVLFGQWMVSMPKLYLASPWTHVGGWKSTFASTTPFATSNSPNSRLGTSTTQWISRNATNNGNAVVANGVDTSVRHMFTVQKTTDTLASGRYNGVQNTTDVSMFSTIGFDAWLALFSRENDKANQTFNGSFYGGMWISGNVPDRDRGILESYMASKIGVTLPADTGSDPEPDPDPDDSGSGSGSGPITIDDLLGGLGFG